MFDLFLYLCVVASGDYTCSIVKGDDLYQSVYQQIEAKQPGAGKGVFESLYRDIPYADPKRKSCEAKGAMILMAAEVFDLPFDDLDYVCIKVDHIDSELKARVHFAGSND